LLKIEIFIKIFWSETICNAFVQGSASSSNFFRWSLQMLDAYYKCSFSPIM